MTGRATPPPMGYARDVIGAAPFMAGFAVVSAMSFRRQDITA